MKCHSYLKSITIDAFGQKMMQDATETNSRDYDT